MSEQLDLLTVQQVVTNRLRKMITSGEFGPGEHLHQDDVALRLGVSRTPVRQAILALESEGLVVRNRHRGATVVVLTDQEIGDIVELRVQLECWALERSVPNLTNDEILKCERLLMDYAGSGDQVHHEALNAAFHDTLYSQAGNDALLEMIAALRTRLYPYRLAALLPEFVEDHAARQHAEILEACKNRDAAKAVEATRTHLRRVRAELHDGA